MSYDGAGEHPLRKLAKDVITLGQQNEYWSQIYEHFHTLADVCQLMAARSESIHREAKLMKEIERLKSLEK